MANDAVSDTSEPRKATQNHANPSHFLYKATLVTLFLVLLPLFPSLAPEFVSETLHARSWEFLQLILVGIAVSYGLFSKRNDETDKDHNHNFNAHESYVWKLLHVSSVFEDESDNHTDVIDDKVQTWSSQYYREEPPVVVVEAKERLPDTNIVNEKSCVDSEINNRRKPLLLPVRSLKQGVIDDDQAGLIDDSGGKSTNARFRSNSFNSNYAGVHNLEKENVVLRSPIPWRSRSGRMEIDEDEESESHAKISSEDVAVIGKKNSIPLPPPPPPPSFLRKSNSSVIKSRNEPSSGKVLARSVRSVPAEEFSHESEMDLKDRVVPSNGVQSGRSVRTFKLTEDVYETKRDIGDEKVAMESSDDESEEEEEDDYFEDISSNVNKKSVVVGDHDNSNENDSSVNTEIGGGPDVDKKADEFIAKFREQIRLQRIESIRRSTAQRAGKTAVLR